MQIEISPAKAEDGGRISEIHVAAMYANPLLHAQFPTEASIVHLQAFLEKHYTSRPPEGHYRLVARLPDSGQVVSFAVWEEPVSPRLLAVDDRDEKGKEEVEGEEKKKLEDGELKWSEGCSREFLEKYAELAEAAMKKATGEEDCYHLEFVCTDPRFQRRGAGLALTHAVLAKARTDGLPVYLESTPDAIAMYERLGFREVGAFEMNIPKRGGGAINHPAETTYREICMVWRPEAPAAGG